MRSVGNVRRRATALCLATLAALAALAAPAKADPRADGERRAALLGAAITPGPVVAWGAGSGGQLGNGETVDSTTPVRALRMRRIIAVNGGSNFSVALRTDGTVWAWGVNNEGQLGDGTTADSSRPVQVCAVGETAPCRDPLTDVVALAAGAFHTLALRSDGSVVAWGSNDYGQLGNGTSADSTTPVQVCAVGQTAPCATFLTGITDLGAGAWHSLVVGTDRTVRSWGLNSSGQLGDGTYVFQRETPVQIALTGVGTVAGGLSHSLALMTDSTVRAWGHNAFGQLGDGTTVSTNAPVQVCAPGQTAPCAAFLGNVNQIAAGSAHSVALGQDQTVLGWGDNRFGQLGDGTFGNQTQTTPVRACAPGATAPCGGNALDTAITIAADGEHTLAIQSDTSALSWGYNLAGQLGDGTTVNRAIPVQVCSGRRPAPCAEPLTSVFAIAAGGAHSLATHG
ncbi:RCC1-like domain-containing protein [Streptomyces sp. NPDC059071]|uniref:RCC1-like domain-containing protein n=1 Tax=unclassified Streptomyces TaxID=2593676 RepID=UPI003668DA72